MSMLFHYIPWLAGIGTVGLIVLVIIFPSTLVVAASWLTALSPLIKGAASLVAQLAQKLYTGFVQVLDDGSAAIMFVVVVALVAWFWPHHHTTKIVSRPCTISAPSPDCKKVIADLHKRFLMTPRPGVAQEPDDEPSGWLSWWSRPQ